MVTLKCRHKVAELDRLPRAGALHGQAAASDEHVVHLLHGISEHPVIDALNTLLLCIGASELAVLVIDKASEVRQLLELRDSQRVRVVPRTGTRHRPLAGG